MSEKESTAKKLKISADKIARNMMLELMSILSRRPKANG